MIFDIIWIFSQPFQMRSMMEPLPCHQIQFLSSQQMKEVKEHP